MSTSTAGALQNYRRRLDGLRAIDAAAGDLSRRLSDHRRWLFETNAQIARFEPGLKSPYPNVQRDTQAKVREFTETATKAQKEIDHLAAELARLQERRGAAATLLARCKEYLVQECGVPAGELAW